MALARVVDTLDGIPDQYKPLYVERDGKFQLTIDIEQGADEKARVAEAARKEREFRTAAEKRAKDAEEALAAYGGMTPEQVAEIKNKQEAAEREIEEKTARSRDEWQKLLQGERDRGELAVRKVTDTLTAQLAEATAVIDHLVLDTALTRAAAELPVAPDMVPAFLAFAREHARIDRGGNGAGTTITVAGKPIVIPATVVNVDDLPISFSDWAKNHFAKSPLGAAMVLEPVSGGGGADNAGGDRKQRVNPFKEGPDFNMTEAGRILKSDGRLAKQLQAEAGARR